MLQKICCFITAAACLLSVIAIAKVSSLQSQVDTLSQRLESTNKTTLDRVDSMRYYVNTRIDEYTNLLVDSSWEFGEADFDAGTVEVTLSVTPKEDRPGDTEAVITVGGEEYPMAADYGTYRVTVPLSLYKETIVDRVVFSSDGETRTEKLSWSIIPRYEFLGTVTAVFSGYTRYSQGEDGCDVLMDGNIAVSVEIPEGGFEIRSAELVEMTDKKEAGRMSVSLFTDADSRTECVGTVLSDAEGIRSCVSLVSEMTYDYTVAKGKKHEIFLEIEDGHGLIHRCKIACVQVDSSGNPTDDDDEWLWHGVEADILSNEGKVLYAVDYNQYM